MIIWINNIPAYISYGMTETSSGVMGKWIVPEGDDEYIPFSNVSVMTVEHLLAAFAGLGIDNAYIDIHGTEVPIMDGSAASFILLVELAGITEQSKPKKFLRIKKNIRDISKIY